MKIRVLCDMEEAIYALFSVHKLCWVGVSGATH